VIEALGIPESIKILTYLMLSFSFFCGIMLLVSREAYEDFNAALQKEFGFKRKFFPVLEEIKTNIIDKLALKYRIPVGLFIAISSFVMLLAYKF
jgi:hypothetical protein